MKPTLKKMLPSFLFAGALMVGLSVGSLLGGGFVFAAGLAVTARREQNRQARDIKAEAHRRRDEVKVRAVAHQKQIETYAWIGLFGSVDEAIECHNRVHRAYIGEEALEGI